MLCEKISPLQCTADGWSSYLDLGIQSNFLSVVLVIVVGVHAQIVEGKLLLYPVLESLALLKGQAVALGNDGDDIDDIAQLLQNDNVNGLEGMAGRLDEEETAVDACVLDVALALSRQLFVEVRAVLVLDVLDNRVPAAVVVDEIAVAGRVNNVQPQAYTVLLDDV
jgi:hypothetical protein